MPQPPPKSRRTSAPSIEHDRPPGGRNFTAWHHLLAEVLQKTAAPGLEVHCFVRLGVLPLEADVIILRLAENADIRTLAQHFGFLVPALRRYLIIEYKSPEDRLTLSDFDTVRAYAMLCKRKYAVAHDEEVAVALLYSKAAADFFAGCARNGYPFVETQPGVWHCGQQALAFYAMDLVALGKQQPDQLFNLLSSLGVASDAAAYPRDLGPFSVLYEEVFLKEMKKMGQMNVPGSELITEKALKLLLSMCSAEYVQKLQAILSPEERLRGIAPEERLRGLPAEERLRGIAPEERLRGLPAEERLRGIAPEERLRGLPAEERLRGIAPEERLQGLSKAELARLRKLLIK